MVSTKVMRMASLAALLLAAPAQSQVASPVAPVGTTQGQVAGQQLGSGVKAWLGIPFAKAPVQDLRWQPPQPLTWAGVLHADRTGPECIQVLRPHNINHYFGEEATSENCLFLNVWAPKTAVAGAKLPVIIFIHGGGNTVGSSGSALYDGEEMAKRGAIFVNFNYRLGILGFMAHPELTAEQGDHSGNYAYLDQVAALRWVHDNIAAFGGDPDKVVITGQSAGAGAVIQQLFSPLAKGLFSGAMMSSGCNWASSPGTTLAQGEQIGMDVQKQLGLSSLAQLRLVPADRILAQQAEFQLGVNRGGIRLGGIIDGYFMPKNQIDILKEHSFNDVPIIAHYNHDEATSPFMAAKTVADYRALAAQIYGADAPAFLALYPAKTDADVLRQVREISLDNGLAKSARNCAKLQTEYNKAPAFISMFSRKPSFAPGITYADMKPAETGAYHTSDIPFWFGTQDAFNKFRQGRAWTDWDRTLSAQMSESLIAFASSGNPSTAAIRWTAWSPRNDARLVLGDSVSMMPNSAKAIDWLGVHPVAAMQANGPAPIAPGGLPGSPRD